MHDLDLYLKAFSTIGGITLLQIGVLVVISGLVLISIKYGLKSYSIIKSSPNI